MSNVG